MVTTGSVFKEGLPVARRGRAQKPALARPSDAEQNGYHPQAGPEPDGPRDSADPRTGSSIRVVSEVTGLPMDTLRAWERRYGIPKPLRREGSNRRLYSAEDVERLGWVASALRRGFRPGDVIAKSPSSIRALLAHDPQEGAHAHPSTPVPSRARSHAQPPDARVADVPTLLELISRDEVAAVESELRVAAAALGPRRFVTEIAHPLSVAVGAAWAKGALAIRQEHLLTELLTTRLRILLASREHATEGPVVLLATLPSEPHTLGLQMIAVYLAVASLTPRLLGANTPPLEIAEAVKALGAVVVGVTVTAAADVAVTRQALKVLSRALPAHVRVWVGGAAADKACASVEGVQPLRSWGEVDESLGALEAAPGPGAGWRGARPA